MDLLQRPCCFLVLLAFFSAFAVNDTFVETFAEVSAVSGQEAALECRIGSQARPILQTWTTQTMSANTCWMWNRFDEDKTDGNCSERITWTPANAGPATLYVNPVALADEGLYTFETATPEGTFNCYITLNVQVPPVVTLTIDGSGALVCQALIGKPAANISWQPACEDCITETLTHHNKTVTVTSKYTARSENETIVCVVSHPTFPVPHNLSTTLTATRSSMSPITQIVIRSFVVLGLAAIVLTLAFIFYRKQQKRRMKSADEAEPPVYYNQSIRIDSRP